MVFSELEQAALRKTTLVFFMPGTVRHYINQTNSVCSILRRLISAQVKFSEPKNLAQFYTSCL